MGKYLLGSSVHMDCSGGVIVDVQLIFGNCEENALGLDYHALLAQVLH